MPNSVLQRRLQHWGRIVSSVIPEMDTSWCTCALLTAEPAAGHHSDAAPWARRDCFEASVHNLCCDWHGGGDGLILQSKRKLSSKKSSYLPFMYLLFLLFVICDWLFFFIHSGLVLVLTLGVCSFWGWNGGRPACAWPWTSKTSVLYCTCILAHFILFRLEENCFFTPGEYVRYIVFLTIWKACLP